MMQDLALRVARPQSADDLPRIDDIRINDVGPVMRAAGDEIELVPMPFSFPPGRSGGAPVFNFRSEGRHFANNTRCVVPASAFFEFTDKKNPKAKHRFALKGASVTAIAALSRPGQGKQPLSFAMLTTAPGPDVAPLSQPSGRGAASRELGGLDSSDQDRGRTAAAAAGGFA
jgi:putative SOS response-associated peptidase YedK